ncbi:FtsX-like permease family protein [Gemmiger sp.]
MNILHKVSLQGLRHNRTRTLVTILGVALSAALFTAVATFGTTLLQYLIDGSAAKNGSWSVEFPAADAAFAAARQADGDVACVRSLGYAVLDGAQESEQSAQKPYLYFVGFDDADFDALPVRLIAGRLPENDREVLIPEHVALKAGVNLPLGTVLDVAVGTRTRDGAVLSQTDIYTDSEILSDTIQRQYTVVGTYQRPGYEGHDAPGYTAITRAAAGEGGRYDVFVTLPNPRQAVSYAESFGVSYVLNEDLLRFYGVSDNASFNALLLTVGGVLVAIIMTGSVFLIYNAFHISLAERTHDFGMLMSVGATARQLRGAVLFEGLCIGAAGIPLGILAGVGCVAALLPLLADKFRTIAGGTSVALRLTVSAPALLAAAAVSLVTILLSAYLPARRAAKLPVMDCLRQTNEIQADRRAVRISPRARRFLGVEGTLALKNFRRNRRQYRSIVLSLTLSVVLFVVGCTFGDTVHRIGSMYTGEKSDGDLTFQTDEMSGDEFAALYAQMSAAEGITGADWVAQAHLAHAEGGGMQPDAYLLFIDDTLYSDFMASVGRSGDALLGTMYDTHHNLYFVGDTVDFTLYDAGGQSLTVPLAMEATYPRDGLAQIDGTTDGPILTVTVPRSRQGEFAALDLKTAYGAFFWADDPDNAMRALQAILAESGTSAKYTLLNVSSMFSTLRSADFVVRVFTFAFAAMMAAISAANVFNTISTNIRQRRRELAMLRSVGMADREFDRMMRIECLFYGLRTLAFGVPLAAALSCGIQYALGSAEQFDGFAIQFPWQSLCVGAVGVFALVAVTMLYAVGKLKRENLLDALREDGV